MLLHFPLIRCCASCNVYLLFATSHVTAENLHLGSDDNVARIEWHEAAGSKLLTLQLVQVHYSD